MRKSGIILHISSLPSQHGIGTLGEEAYNFVRFLKKSKVKFWQVLPLNQTSYGDSPYQSPSAYAGNPYFVDLDILINEGLLKKEYVNSFDFGDDPLNVDYGKMFENRYIVLREAFNNFEKSKEYDEFCENNKFWLEDYSLFMAIKVQFNFASFQKWDKDYKIRDNATIANFINKNEKEINFWKFVQFEFFKQYLKLKNFALENGVEIIGDMPIYVALDSSDVWANKEYFLLDEDMSPSIVAGVPPDSFTEDGQLWGNPIYDWDYMKKDNYYFWEKRISFASKMYDLVRIDHFRGFAGYYVIDAKATSAKEGKWVEGPSYDLFKTLSKSIDVSKIIAENLGFLTQDVYDLVEQTGYMGMKVAQFGLLDDKDEYYYKNFDVNSIAYTGTHDNETTIQCIDNFTKKQKDVFVEIFNEIDEKTDLDKVIGAVFSSKSTIAVVPMQDFLCQSEQSRMNFPSKPMGYWRYRILQDDLNDSLCERIKYFIEKYNRA